MPYLVSEQVVKENTGKTEQEKYFLGQKPRIILSMWLRGEPFCYTCSLCGRAFILPEDRNPTEGLKEVWAAFHEHVSEEHPARETRVGDMAV
jgi:hypothetical protein